MPAFPRGRYALHGRELQLPLVGDCGFLHRRESLPLGWHEHAGWECTFALTEATEWELADGTVLPLAGGSWSLIPPGLRHHGLDEVIRPMQLCWVVWHPERADAARRTPFTAAELAGFATELRRAGICAGRMPPAL